MTNARLEELRAKFQENPRRYFAPFANELRKAGDPAQAISVCRAHLAGQPGHVSGHIVLGQALYEAGEANEARAIFTAALELDPENLIALRTLGEIAQVNGEFGAARQWYQRLLDADPRNSEVSQLLKDMPAEAAAAPAVPELPPEALEEPTPFTVRTEVEQEPAAEAQRSTFHTSFTGSGPKYESKEDVQAEAITNAPSDGEAFIDLDPSAHEDAAAVEPVVEQPVLAASATDESVEMVDFDALPEEPVVEAPAESAPDESFEPFVSFSSELPTESDVEMSRFAPPRVPEVELNEIDVPTGDYSTADTEPSDEPAESPKARFAERGFDSPTADEVGWMTTPSAALSDPEAAPEDWFDESVSLEAEDVAPQASVAEPAPVEMSQPDTATDSWFDDVEGASSIEATEITSDELWLPPELPRFSAPQETTARAEQPVEEPAAPETTSAGEVPFDETLPETVSAHAPNEEPEPAWSPDEVTASAEPAEEPEPTWMAAEEPATSPEVPDEAESSWAASAEPGEPEPMGFDIHAMAEAADEAFIVEHPEVEPASSQPEPVEEPVVSSWTEPTHQASWTEPTDQTWTEPTDQQPAEPEAVEQPGMDSHVEVFHAGSESIVEATRDDAFIGHTPDSVEAVAPTPAPFITETLAELYLQQGFRDEALSIFRQLADRDPDNRVLSDRIAAIEKGETPALSQPEIPAEERAATQSVRTFFSRLARRAAVPPSSEPHVSSEPAPANPDVPFAAAASALANLFAASNPPATDEGAASTLAGAFSDPAGRPSRAADRELSLDHLFRDVPPGGSPTGGVTLDEFYSTPDAAQGSPTEPGEATGSEEPGGADIRQFTAWLEGLRKK